METYLLNFHPLTLTESTPLRLAFHKRMREERRWPTPEALREQIGLDVRRAERFFALSKALIRQAEVRSAGVSSGLAVGRV